MHLGLQSVKVILQACARRRLCKLPPQAQTEVKFVLLSAPSVASAASRVNMSYLCLAPIARIGATVVGQGRH